MKSGRVIDVTPTSVSLAKREIDTLANLSRVRVLLAEASTLPEVKKFRDVAEAAKTYAKTAHLSRQVQNEAADIALDASRKAGEIVGRLKKSKGGDPSVAAANVAGASAYRQVLQETATKERTAEYWQKLAEVPEETVQKYKTEVRKTEKGEITAAGLLREHAKVSQKPLSINLDGLGVVLRSVRAAFDSLRRFHPSVLSKHSQEIIQLCNRGITLVCTESVNIFRYPGGKSKLLSSFPFPGHIEEYSEPFVGGGSVALHVAQRYTLKNCKLNDLNPYVYAFWKVVAEGSDEEVAELLAKLDVAATVPLFEEIQASKPDLLVDKAFRCLFLNRTTFSGILTSGPIGGYEQTGNWLIDARWNPEALDRNIRKAREILQKANTQVYGLPWEEFLENHATGFMYLDPPYYVKGDELYGIGWSHEDHIRLQQALFARVNWLLSYDNNDDIKRLYEGCKIEPLLHYRSISDNLSDDPEKRRRTDHSEILIFPPDEAVQEASLEKAA